MKQEIIVNLDNTLILDSPEGYAGSEQYSALVQATVNHNLLDKIKEFIRRGVEVKYITSRADKQSIDRALEVWLGYRISGYALGDGDTKVPLTERYTEVLAQEEDRLGRSIVVVDNNEETYQAAYEFGLAVLTTELI